MLGFTIAVGLCLLSFVVWINFAPGGGGSVQSAVGVMHACHSFPVRLRLYVWGAGGSIAGGIRISTCTINWKGSLK